jgi:hypothetical protein
MLGLCKCLEIAEVNRMDHHLSPIWPIPWPEFPFPAKALPYGPAAKRW